MSTPNSSRNILIAVQSGKMILWHLVDASGRIREERIFEHGAAEIGEELPTIVYRIRKMRHDPKRQAAGVVFTNLDEEASRLLARGISGNDGAPITRLSPAEALSFFIQGKTVAKQSPNAGQEAWTEIHHPMLLVIDERTEVYVPDAHAGGGSLFTPGLMILRSDGFLHPSFPRGSAAAEFSSHGLAESLSFAAPGGPLEIQARFRSRLRRGEPDARKYFSRFCENLAFLCINLHSMFPGRELLLYGPLVSSDPMFQKTVRENINKIMYPVDAGAFATSVRVGLDYLRCISSGAGMWFGTDGSTAKTTEGTTEAATEGTAAENEETQS